MSVSRKAVLAKVGTGMAAEVARAYVLTGILDLELNKCLCVQSVHQRINQILIKQRASLQVGVESIRNTDKWSIWQLKPRSQCPSGDCTRHANVC